MYSLAARGDFLDSPPQRTLYVENDPFIFLGKGQRGYVLIYDQNYVFDNFCCKNGVFV